MKDLNSETMDMNVKEEMSSREDDLGEEFFPDIRPTQTTTIYHLVPDMEIKQEEVDFHYNTSTSDVEADSEFKTVSNFQHIDCTSIDDEFMSEFYLDLRQCDKKCETCTEYMRLLSEHVRTSHALPQLMQVPLLIDPLHIADPPQPHQSSSVQIKCEVEENIVKMECSDEDSMPNAESDPDFELESGNESESDPEYSPSTHSTQNSVKISGYTSSNNKSLTVHEKTHAMQTEEKRFKCDMCVKTFRRKYDLSVHKLIHAREKSHVCKDCGLGFISLSRLTKHKRTHSEEKPFKCDVCGKAFRLETRLNEHKRVHTGEKPFQCDVCEKCFSVVDTLKTHKVVVHAEVKPHKCDQCDKGFAKKSNLINHKRTHTGEKPFKCDVCVKNFCRNSELTLHKRIHLEERPYKCDECDKTFKRADVLSGHKRTHTGEKFKCDACMKTFAWKCDLNKHKKVSHTFQV